MLQSRSPPQINCCENDHRRDINLSESRAGSSLRPRARPPQRFNWRGAHIVIGPTHPSTASPIIIDFAAHFLSLSKVMRLLVEILIIAAVIYLGWNKPFKEQVARAKATITSTLDGMGGTLQKNQDKSVRRY